MVKRTKGNPTTSDYPVPDGRPGLHRPRRNYWGNLVEEDIYREEESKPQFYDYFDFDSEDDCSSFYDSDNYD